MSRGGGILGVLTAVSLLGAPAAQAADTFADAAIGDDANVCTSAAAPCATIAAAIAKSGDGDTIRVAPGIYAEQLTLGGGRSLRATGTAASTVLDSATAPTLDVTSAAGTIEGFTIRGTGTDPNGAMRLQAPATVRGNLFDGDDDGGPGTARPVDLRIAAGAGSPTVSENTFADDGQGNQTAVSTSSTGSPAISENHISGFFRGVSVNSGTPAVRENIITASHNSPTLSQGAGIMIEDSATGNAAPVLAANLIANPAADSPNGVTIIDFVHGPGSTTVGATLRRNRILGHSVGVSIGNATAPPVTLDSDLIAGSTTLGMISSDSVGSSSDVTATNVTFAANNGDVFGSDVAFAFNSVIVEDAIGAAAGTSCSIGFSRGPTMVAGGNGCQNFQTTAAPDFVDAAALDFHLLGFPQNPTLFGGGDPASPGVGARDFDGDLRELPANGTSAPNREIGADEILPGGYSPAETAIDDGPGTTASNTSGFSFSSSPAGATFECALDGRAFTECTSPEAYAGLGGGTHTFRVRSTDPTLQGNTDPTPATRTFTVDATPPDTQIADGPPAGSTTGSTVDFAFTSEPGATFECSLDRAAFAPCGASTQLAGLANGEHTLLVRAIDAVGNADPTPSSRAWTVAVTDGGDGGGGAGGGTDGGGTDGGGAEPDTDPPETVIRKVKVKGDDAKAKFASDELGSRFQCKLDRKKFKRCRSPRRMRNLDDGRHKFKVRAIDPAGNVDPTPAKKRFVV